ncbi:hypothetical protein ACFYVL_12505 [Streptomyces sp. NPDC004111]|uniref:hypothetical protein n=1 Tax=Streptomyces sp. NPDC004111 TaxID=3364690 RepID=UPI0036B9518E
MVRRPTAVVTGAVLIVEAVGVVFVNIVLGKVVANQSMSLAGSDPDTVSGATFALGAVFGLYLAACAFFLIRAAITDRAPGRLGRILLVVAAVVHGVLGALAVGLVSWWAFAYLMVVLGLLVLTLMLYGGKDDRLHDPAADGPPAPPERPAAPPGNGSPAAA